MEHLISRFLIPGHAPAPDPGTSLPHLAVGPIILLQSLLGADQRTPVPLRAEPQIHPVNQLPAFCIQIRHQGPGQPRAGFRIVSLPREKDQIEVGKKVQIGGSQLAERQDGKGFHVSLVGVGRLLPGQRQGCAEHKLGQRGIAGGGFPGRRQGGEIREGQSHQLRPLPFPQGRQPPAGRIRAGGGLSPLDPVFAGTFGVQEAVRLGGSQTLQVVADLPAAR